MKDNSNNEIELITFKQDIPMLLNYKLDKGYFIFNQVKSILNNKTVYKKTNHNFKLKFETHQTTVKKITSIRKVENNKIFIENIKKKKNINNKNGSKQLSILNFVNNKCKNYNK